MPQEKWAVIGGGFLGMTIALRLSQQGKAVTLFEAAPAFGGLASAWQLGDVVWDRHYHVILASDKYLLGLLRELGLEDKLQWGTTKTGFYIDSTIHSLSNTSEFLRFPTLSLIDKLRLAATILYASRIREGKSLESILVTDWLTKWSGSGVVEKLWIPLLRAKLGESYHVTSAAFIWASISRMYGARSGSAKKESFGYFPTGYAFIIQHFAEALKRANVSFRLGQPIKTITRIKPGEVMIDLTDGTQEIADHVVVTTASPLAVKMCPQLTTAEKEQLNGISYQGILCASLLLKNPLSEFYITNITNPRVPYTAVVEMTALVPHKYFGGRSLVYLPKYVASDAAEFQLADDQVQECFLESLEQMYPRFSRQDLLYFQLSRIKYLLPIPTLNYSERLPDIFTSVPGVYIVNSSHIVNGTLNVNETVELAERAARRFASIVNRSELPTYEVRQADSQPFARSRQ